MSNFLRGKKGQQFAALSDQRTHGEIQTNRPARLPSSWRVARVSIDETRLLRKAQPHSQARRSE